ncbi:hypothetical protein ACTGZW_11790, partial [Streptococcus suis]
SRNAIYRSLDLLNSLKEDLQLHLHKEVSRLTKREARLVFYDVILFKKQKLTYNRFMKLTIEQTKELKTYLKDKTYSPFHRRLQ